MKCGKMDSTDNQFLPRNILRRLRASFLILYRRLIARYLFYCHLFFDAYISSESPPCHWWPEIKAQSGRPIMNILRVLLDWGEKGKSFYHRGTFA